MMKLSDATQKGILSVLLVEDSPTEAMLIEALLEDSDFPRFSVDIVNCLGDAMDYLAHNACDIVVLDLTLPDSQGLDTYRRVREQQPTMPVVVVTANSSKSIAFEAIQIGAQDYILKEQVENMPLALSLRFAIERKRGENDIIRRQHNLQTVIKSTPVGMLLINEGMTIEMANNAVAELVGKKADELVGQTLQQGLLGTTASIPSESCENSKTTNPLISICKSVFESDRGVMDLETQERFYINKREFRFWLHVCCSPAILDDRKHVILALNDVTAKMEAMEIKNQVMSMVSHELRSPLSAMKEAVSIILDELPGPINKDQRDMLDIVQRNLNRMHRLTDDFLDLQKLRAGKISFKMTDGNINNTIEEVAETMKSAIKSQGLDLVLDLDRSIPPQSFDKDRLVQVFVNLVNNSVKFTEEGSITLLTSHKQGEVHISVKDTGRGMPPEETPKLFEEFRQLSNTKTGGTGLGLNIAKRIIEGHMGRIEVESQLGQGTCVTVILPNQTD